jgi:hypothetical protein
MSRSTKEEEQVELYYQVNGWTVFKPIWPDFVMINQQTGEIQMVEVKSQGERLSLRQATSFNWLQKLGFTIKIAFTASWFEGKIKERMFGEDLNVTAIRRRKVVSTPKKKEKKEEWDAFLKPREKVTFAPYIPVDKVIREVE